MSRWMQLEAERIKRDFERYQANIDLWELAMNPDCSPTLMLAEMGGYCLEEVDLEGEPGTNSGKPAAKSEPTPTKSKRGPRKLSIPDKIAAVNEWDRLDRDLHAITLEEWLEERFGATNGILKVAPSTFHGWRRRYLKNS